MSLSVIDLLGIGLHLQMTIATPNQKDLADGVKQSQVDMMKATVPIVPVGNLETTMNVAIEPTAVTHDVIETENADTTDMIDETLQEKTVTGIAMTVVIVTIADVLTAGRRRTASIWTTSWRRERKAGRLWHPSLSLWRNNWYVLIVLLNDSGIAR